jgi:hypothetical protein
MSSFTHVEPDIQLSFKAEKGKVFVLLLLGIEARDGSKPLDAVAVLDAMGWAPKQRLAKSR